MSSYSILLCVLLISHLCFADPNTEWQNFKLKFNKMYNSAEEEEFRKSIFVNSLKFVNQHNQKQKSGVVSYETEINKFSDMTDREFHDIYLNSRMEQDNFPTLKVAQFEKNSKKAPKSRNWIDEGFKNPILNQGKCGSCYTFGAIAAIEVQYFIKTGKLIQLSHQEVMDCSKYLGNNGCYGGLTNLTLKYAIENGIGYESNHRYLAKESVCVKTEPRFKISEYYQIQKGDENALKEVVGTIGPVGFGFDAVWPSFRYYKSGIYYESQCKENNLAHAMAIVGYGSENGQDYWLIRNSWGEDWGNKGHIKVSRNKNNNCGVATRALYPVI